MDLSDHLAIHTKILLDTNTNLSHKTAKGKINDTSEFRIFNEANDSVFKQLIDDESWDDVPDNLNAQDSYNKFEEIYSNHYNHAYLLKSTRNRRKK